MDRISAYGLLRLATLAAVAAGLVACAAPTPYQPAYGGYGYAEQPLEENRYRVSFTGNSETSRETVENYLLYRAAEVTLQRGYDYFVVANRDVERSTSYRSTGSSMYDSPVLAYPHFGYGFGGGSYVGLGTSWARPVDEYEGYADIVMHRGRKPAQAADAYDAREIANRLAPLVQPPPNAAL